MNKIVSAIFVFLMIFVSVVPIFADDYINLDVVTEFAGVEVFIDDIYQGVTKSQFAKNILSVKIPSAGTYTLTCRYEGYNDYKKTITITKPLVEVVKFQEASIRAQSEYDVNQGATSSTTGNFIVHSEPQGATCRIIGKQQSSTTTNGTFDSVPIGDYTVEFFFNRNNPDEFLSTDVEIRPGDTIHLVADFYGSEIIDKTEYVINFISVQDETGILSIDGQEKGTLPREVSLIKGNHTITYSPGLPQYALFEQELVVDQSQLYRIALNIEKYPVTFIGSEHVEGDFYIDGAFIATGKGNIEVYMKPGIHSITFKPNDERYEDYENTLKIDAHDTIEISLKRAKYEVKIENSMNFAGQLLIDGRAYGEAKSNAKTSILLSPGVYTIEFNHSDARYEDFKKNIYAYSDQTITIGNLDTAKYMVNIESDPSGAKVYNGAEYLGITPTRSTLPYGSYDLKFEKDGYNQYTGSLLVDRNREFSVKLNEIGATVALVPDTLFMPHSTVKVGDISISGTKTGILSGKQTVSIGDISFEYNFENMHRYEITPYFPLPKQNLFSESDSYPGKTIIPTYPGLLEERIPITKKFLKPEHKDSFWVQMFAFPGMGALLSAAISGPKEVPEDLPVWGNALIGAGIGGIFSLILYNTKEFQEAHFYETVVDYKPDEANIATNKSALSSYEVELAEAESKNKETLNRLNKQIQEDNLRVKEINRERDFIEVKNLNKNIVSRFDNRGNLLFVEEIDAENPTTQTPAPETPEIAVGAIGPSGGYVFYENPNYAADGWRYLEAAPAGWNGGRKILVMYLGIVGQKGLT